MGERLHGNQIKIFAPKHVRIKNHYGSELCLRITLRGKMRMDDATTGKGRGAPRLSDGYGSVQLSNHGIPLDDVTSDSQVEYTISLVGEDGQEQQCTSRLTHDFAQRINTDDSHGLDLYNAMSNGSIVIRVHFFSHRVIKS